MPKQIQFLDEPPFYEVGRDSLRFRAMVDGKETTCRVTGEWLLQVGRAGGMSRQAMLAAFAVNKANIQDAARRLIEQCPEAEEIVLRTGRSQ